MFLKLIKYSIVDQLLRIKKVFLIPVIASKDIFLIWVATAQVFTEFERIIKFFWGIIFLGGSAYHISIFTKIYKIVWWVYHFLKWNIFLRFHNCNILRLFWKLHKLRILIQFFKQKNSHLLFQRTVKSTQTSLVLSNKFL